MVNHLIASKTLNIFRFQMFTLQQISTLNVPQTVKTPVVAMHGHVSVK